MHLPHIITCAEWGARPPKQGLEIVGAPNHIIFHHTAGHSMDRAPKGVQSKAEAMAYARSIQNFHMDTHGWNDSGHNFLVCRGGWILEGRHMSVASIHARHMVVSAHCPGHNDQPGIEHEHQGSEKMTAVQIDAAAELQAWIAYSLHRTMPLNVYPHRQFSATDCPGEIGNMIAPIRSQAAKLLHSVGV